MDWGFIFERTFSTMFGVEVMVFALAAVGLNVQFGYAGLLNFGQVGFMAAGAYGLGRHDQLAGSGASGSASSSASSTRSILALILGLPTLRLTRRLPGDRHDRRIRERSGCSCVGAG